ncbi:hypothetical protein RR48_00890 [Papilio machaon]|uniref:Uncharacterized protein n=1 Tax=Papilio machaon TaxID=76193 RepID=A0A0N1PH65_PAPMA|nr:hypothetical protein RR48_00890 [Papilio machaon]
MYAAITAVLFLQLALATVAAALAILNATKNPTEPIFGLPVSGPAVISYGMYAAITAVLFLQLALATVAAALAILNATKNPTEPIFGLPGCLWTNVVTAILGVTVLMMFGIYWATSGLNQHLALSYIAAEVFAPDPSLGYSYW